MQLLFFERVFVFSVDETNSLEKVFEVGVAAEFSPAFGSTLSELERERPVNYRVRFIVAFAC